MDLEDFEVDFDLGEFLKNGDREEVSESIAAAGTPEPATTPDFRQGFAGSDRAVSPPPENPSSSRSDFRDFGLGESARILGTSAKRSLRENDQGNVQKKAKTASEEPMFLDFLDMEDSLDWTVPRTLNVASSPARADEEPPQRSLENDFGAPEIFGAKSQKLAYTIPGPAGAMQLGIKRSEPCEVSRNENPFDHSDFRSSAWLAALRYCQIGEIDPVKYSRRDSTISHIKSSSCVERIPQLLAIIQSCTPNGCGDAFVTLKDPTGTIGGTVHKRVLAETEFGRDIVPGAVIVLSKVTVFKQSIRAQYLNITIHNVVQVFSASC